MKLADILKGSEYSLELFDALEISELENRIIEKIDKKGRLIQLLNVSFVAKK